MDRHDSRFSLPHPSGGIRPATARFYVREVPQWAVLLQLVIHVNEHLGQEIVYACTNRALPPWSR